MTYSDQFERWWRGRYIPGTMTPKEAAWAAWQGSRAAGTVESFDVHEDPNVDRQVDWAKASAETSEASALAQRHGLCIASVPGTKDRYVEATRGIAVIARTKGWRAMIDELKAMAKRGEL